MIDLKAILWKYYFEEMPLKEIAGEYGISEQTMAQRMSRARKVLVNVFKRRWGHLLIKTISWYGVTGPRQ